MSAALGIAIRAATEDDIDFLVEVLVCANADRYRRRGGWDAERFVALARASTTEQVRGAVADSVTSIVAVAGERAGRLRIVRTQERIEIAGIQLLPAFQRRGIGTAVIRALLHEGRQHGLPVVLEVAHDNPQARQLYRRLGFEPIEETDDHTRMIVLPGKERKGGEG